LYLRRLLGLQPAPEFAAWLQQMGIMDGNAQLGSTLPHPFQQALGRLAAFSLESPLESSLESSLEVTDE
jgi:hypothetical protein